MRADGGSSWTIRWRASAPPQTACLLQAVLLTGVFVVFAQIALTTLISGSDVTLQAGLSIVLQFAVFLVALPLVWFWCKRIAVNKATEDRVPTEIEFTPDHIRCLGQSMAGPLSVVEVSRQLGALTVKLQSQLEGKASFSITIWRANLNEQIFRKLSVLVAWHAQRSA